MPRLALMALLACVTLAACGADGAPRPPGETAPPPGITLSGEARIGVVEQ
jgi:hypothetical protein